MIDASGSLIDLFCFVIDELKRSINELTEQQVFTVIFFHGDDPAVEVPSKGLRTANTKNKQSVYTWIEPSAGHVAPGGSSNPIKAIELALNHHAGEIYFALGSRENWMAAAGHFARITDGIHEPPYPPQWWNAWMRKFQIMDRLDMLTGDIPLRVRALRRMDDELGGPRYQRKIQRLANKYFGRSENAHAAKTTGKR